MRKSHIRTYVRTLSLPHIFPALLALAIVVVFFMSGALRTKAVSPEETSAENARKYFMSYEVKPGDTLWDLASEYNDFSLQDSSSYIEDVRTINHISDDEIHAGRYIVLPYYK